MGTAVPDSLGRRLRCYARWRMASIREHGRVVRDNGDGVFVKDVGSTGNRGAEFRIRAQLLRWAARARLRRWAATTIRRRHATRDGAITQCLTKVWGASATGRWEETCPDMVRLTFHSGELLRHRAEYLWHQGMICRGKAVTAKSHRSQGATTEASRRALAARFIKDMLVRRMRTGLARYIKDGSCSGRKLDPVKLTFNLVCNERGRRRRKHKRLMDQQGPETQGARAVGRAARRT